MRVKLLFFAAYRDAVGTDALELDLPDGSTVGDAIEQVRVRAGADALPGSPAVAVNREYAAIATVLADGDEVAFIPPVAGG